MAKAQSKTVALEVRSLISGENRLVFERSYVKSTRVGNRYITASKLYSRFDKQGRRYERASDTVLICTTAGEPYHVIGEAERIRQA